MREYLLGLGMLFWFLVSTVLRERAQVPLPSWTDMPMCFAAGASAWAISYWPPFARRMRVLIPCLAASLFAAAVLLAGPEARLYVAVIGSVVLLPSLVLALVSGHELGTDRRARPPQR